jgi:DNA topoisomerase-1
MTSQKKGNGMRRLVICEKDNAAKRIATILSDGSFEKEMVNGVPVYRFTENSRDCSVIGLRGHILSLDYEAKYSIWHRIKPRDLIDLDPKKRVIAHNIAGALTRLGAESDEVIVATDYDREGELIGVEALETIQGAGADPPAKRARFSSLTKGDVEHAFSNLGAVDHHLSDSALARQTVDLVWGAVLTRFISISSERVGKDFLSVGRVQTPTLAIILDREDEIAAFQPEPYWEIDGEVEKLDPKRVIKVHTGKDRYHNKADAERVMAAVKGVSTGKIVSIKRNRRREKPPTPFNTTQFLAVASTLGFAAARAMSIAEDLYTNGYISYPRTDNTVYPPSENLRDLLQALARPNSAFEKEALELLQKEKLTPTRGKTEATDHPPIHPTEAAGKAEFAKDKWAIYELIVRRFFATLADEAISEVTQVTVDIGGEPFLAKGLKTITPGWRKYYTYVSSRETELPPLTEGETVNVLHIDMVEKKTQPPKRYTQGGLIQLMESLGLGTKSTRHEIIQKLYARDYVKERTPVPTDSGIAVTRALKKWAEPITRSEMTATLEKDMDDIAEGRKQVKDVVQESRQMLVTVMDVLEANRAAIGHAIKEALRTQNVLGPCPKCNGTLTIMRSWKGKRFVGCSGYPKCRNSFPLPQRGRIDLHPEKCPACANFQVNVHHGRRRPWTVCLNPKCPSRAEREARRNQAEKEGPAEAAPADGEPTQDSEDQKGGME